MRRSGTCHLSFSQSRYRQFDGVNVFSFVLHKTAQHLAERPSFLGMTGILGAGKGSSDPSRERRSQGVDGALPCDRQPLENIVLLKAGIEPFDVTFALLLDGFSKP